jgi:hypothetical protein
MLSRSCDLNFFYPPLSDEAFGNRLSGILFGLWYRSDQVDSHSILSFYRNGLPILVTLVSFWHFAIVRQQLLTPSIAFTSILGDCQVGFQVVRGVLTNITFLCSFLRDEVCAQCFT